VNFPVLPGFLISQIPVTFVGAMKRTFVAILAILYLTITSGVVVNVHYCMGRFASVEYGADDHDVCGKCGMSDKKNKCCHTESKLVKVQDAHQLAKTQVQLLELPAEAPVQYSLFQQPVAGQERYLALQYHSPPDSRLNTVYLRNCVFRI
jgi:hypothetical protein